MASTLQEQLAAKKADKEAADKKAAQANQDTTTSAATGPATTTVPSEVSKEEAAQNLKATQKVAEEAGTKQTPEAPTGPGAPIATGIQNSIVQSGATTDAQKQVERTEVDPHLTIVEEPRGSDRSAPNPPGGTLPNSNLVYHGEEGSVMNNLHKNLTAGLEQNKLTPEQEKEIADLAEGEARRQRMLSGFPQDGDLAQQQEEADVPEGGWKATGIFRIVLQNGSVFKAENGYFVPSTEEEEKELKYFKTKGLVEEPTK